MKYRLLHPMHGFETGYLFDEEDFDNQIADLQSAYNNAGHNISLGQLIEGGHVEKVCDCGTKLILGKKHKSSGGCRYPTCPSCKKEFASIHLK